MSSKTEHKETIKELESLREAPDRDPVQAARGRAQFLLEAKQISEETVSISLIQRLSSVFQAPQLRMSTLTIAIILSLLLVSFTTSATAASQALPNQFLYPYKIWLENQRLALTINPQKEAELHLIYAQERLAELDAIQDEDLGTQFDQILENFLYHLNAAEEIFSEHQEYVEQEEIINRLETQAPQPSPEFESESDEEEEHEEEPEETPEPDFSDEDDREDEPDYSDDPDETDTPDGDDSGDDNTVNNDGSDTDNGEGDPDNDDTNDDSNDDDNHDDNEENDDDD
ncbi:MAG: hypothetical protein JW757_03805 [Anaerolineales bacterium]|nr:hypothetical protein [Anaerolineales bacterium]